MITEILKPKTVREAVKAKSAPGSAYLGGGTWLNSGKAPAITRLISLEHLDLGRVECDRGRCVIGAAVTLQQVVESGHAPRALRAAAELEASRTLRNMKTMGGELGLGAADSAIIAVLVALRAVVLVAGRRASIAIEAFLVGPAAPLILSVIIPDAERPCALRSVSRTSHGLRSLLVAVSLRGATPVITDPVIAISDCRSSLHRLIALEKAFGGNALAPAASIEKLVGETFAPEADPFASGVYKRYLAGVHVADCFDELSGPEARP